MPLKRDWSRHTVVAVSLRLILLYCIIWSLKNVDTKC